MVGCDNKLMPAQMISELAAMMVERLEAFRAKSRRLPERVLVYRDGVSEVCFITHDISGSH